MSQTTENKILKRINNRDRGTAYTSKDFLDLGTHDAVRQSLYRMNQSGKLRRLLHGVYEYPAHSRLLGGPASPNPDAIAQAIARANGWTLIPSGDTALNRLGLSTQLPARWEYYTDGPTKTYEWDGGTITLKRRANRQTKGLSPKTALLVQALKALGRERIDEGILEKLRAQLDPKDLKKALREARYVTAWVYETIKRLADESDSAHA